MCIHRETHRRARANTHTHNTRSHTQHTLTHKTQPRHTHNTRSLTSQHLHPPYTSAHTDTPPETEANQQFLGTRKIRPSVLVTPGCQRPSTASGAKRRLQEARRFREIPACNLAQPIRELGPGACGSSHGGARGAPRACMGGGLL